MKSKKKHTPKFIFVTGGIVSGIGKGISVASIGALLKARNLRVLPIKIDPYLNKDAGTMNPYQHGEVFVLEDGTETDLDLGHYERFIDVNLRRDSNFTTGAVYDEVLKLERHGDFLGQTIQIIPHVTDAVKTRILSAAHAHRAECVLVEIGGTVGDIEAEPFLEAARQMHQEYGGDSVAFVHVVKMDYIFPSEESKTKPIQQSVALLRARGIQPDCLIVRCKRPMTSDNFRKISLFTNVPISHVIAAPNAESLYDIPVNFKRQKLDATLAEKLGWGRRVVRFAAWEQALKKMHRARKEVEVAIVGKYVENPDAYLSVVEAVRHAAAHLGIRPKILFMDATKKRDSALLSRAHAVIVPGGFGARGMEGKISAIKYARTHAIPFLGLCLGLQAAVIEHARNVVGLVGAHSTEMNSRTKYPVIDLLPDQRNLKELGGTMHLGNVPVALISGTRVQALYGSSHIVERHRHRYEVHPRYHTLLQEKGLQFSGFKKSKKPLVEFIERRDHPFFVATQAHPEFLSRFVRPHPLFVGLLRAAMKRERGSRA